MPARFGARRMEAAHTRLKGVQGLDLDFASGRYALNSPYGSAFPAGWSFSRTGAATALDLAGNVIQFATGVPRITNRGLLVEEGRTNLLLNSATLSTQTVAATAVPHTLSFYGTGTVTLTGASTAGPLVGTGANNRVTLTFTPIVGPLLLTVTGSVTTAQLEAGSSASSPIITTGAAGTRGGDVPLLTGVPFYAGGVTLLAELEELTAAAPASANEFITSLSDNSINNRISLFRIQGTSSLGSRSTVGGAATNPGDIASVLGVGVRRAGASVLAGRSISAVGGTISTSAAPASVPPYTQLNVGLNDTANGSWVNAYIRRIRIIPRAVSDAELVALTA